MGCKYTTTRARFSRTQETEVDKARGRRDRERWDALKYESGWPTQRHTPRVYAPCSTVRISEFTVCSIMGGRVGRVSSLIRQHGTPCIVRGCRLGLDGSAYDEPETNDVTPPLSFLFAPTFSILALDRQMYVCFQALFLKLIKHETNLDFVFSFFFFGL